MSKAPSPLLGYNNNVRHKNRVFHIQTEDSGIKHPHIITHIFMDGGRILKSVKTSYADHVGEEKLGDIVRQMMKEQHKAAFRALRDGELDPIVDEALAAAAARGSLRPPPPRVPTPPPESAPKTQRDERPPAPAEASPLTLDLDALDTAQPAASFKPEGDLPPPPPNVLTARGGDPGTGRYRTLEDRAGEERAPQSRKSERPPRTDRMPSAPPAAHAKKSERPPPASVRPPRSERPPRTAAKSDRPRSDRGAVREERVKRNDPRAEPPSEPKQPVATGSSRPQREPAKRAPGPAAVRPAAIFGQARPQQSSIFGEDIISDKSLDEVILSYLAEDLEEGSK